MSLKTGFKKMLSLVMAAAMVTTLQIPFQSAQAAEPSDADVVIDFSQEAGEMIPKTGWLLIPNEDIPDGRILPLNTQQVRDDTDMQAVLGNNSDATDEAHMSDILPNEFNRFERLAESSKRMNDLGIVTTHIMGFMPSWISKNGTSQGAPKDYNMWHQWSKDMAQYIKDHDLNINEFNVWNENWNISENEFNYMYKESWNAVKQIIPDALMIGPDTVGYVPQNFFDFCQQNGLTTDVVSYHFVGDLQSFQEDLINRTSKVPSLGVQKYYYQEYQWDYEIFNHYRTIELFAEFDRISSVDVACRGIWNYANGLSDMLVLNPESQNICARTPSWWAMAAYGSMAGIRIAREKSTAVPYIASKDTDKGEMKILVGSNSARNVSFALTNQPFAGEDLVIEKYQVLGEGADHISLDEDNGIQLKETIQADASGDTVNFNVDFAANDVYMIVVKKAESAPSDFALMGPDDNTAALSTPTFTWQKAEGAEFYDLVISKNKDMSSPVYTKEGITENTFTIDQALEMDQIYYWTVTARNQYGETAPYNNMYYSFVVKENTDVPGGFTLFQVVNNAYGTKLNPRFTWSKAREATSYKVYISENEDFSNATIKTFELSDLTEYPTDKNEKCYGFELKESLKPETHYYTKIVACNESGERTMTGGYHEFTTTTADGKPAEFNVTEPGNEESVDPRATLRWERSLGGFFYQLEIATDPDFENIVLSQDYITVPAYTLEQDVLEPETTYYWRVTARNKERTLETVNSNGVQCFTTSSKPTPPLVKVSIPTNGGAVLQFNPVSDADTYTVKYGTVPGEYTETIEGITDSIAYIPVEEGETYYATVVSVRNGVESDVWNEVEVSASPSGSQVIKLDTELECENADQAGNYTIKADSGASNMLSVLMETGSEIIYTPMTESKYLKIAYIAPADTSVAVYNGKTKVTDIFLPQTENGNYGTVSAEMAFAQGDTLRLVKETKEETFSLDYILLSKDSLENLALGKKVTASSEHLAGTYSAENAVDGDVNTWWDSGALPAEIIVDLGSVSEIHSVSIQMPPTFGHRTQEIQVFVSNDNEEGFTSLKEKETYTFKPDENNNTTMLVDLEKPVSARYVKLVVTDNEDYSGPWENGGQAGEIFIMGIGGKEETDDNLALHKPVTVLPESSNGSPERITDGIVGADYTTSWDGVKDEENVVTIDLLRPYQLTDYEIQIPFNFGQRSQDFQFLVSQDGHEFTEIIPTKTYSFDPAVEQNTVKIQLPENVLARYVQLIGSKNDVAGEGAGKYGTQIAEWRVYGTSTPVTSIDIDQDNMEIPLGASEQLSATLEPAEAEYRDVAWSSSDVTVATVGANGVVTAKAKGECEIRARSLENPNCVDKITITVGDPVISQIIVKQPDKTEYRIGEELDLTGMTVTARYTDSGEKQVAIDDCVITGYDKNKAGEQTITVSYAGQTDTFVVNVKAELTDIVVTPPAQTEYVIGDELNLEGFKVTAKYSDNTQKEISADQVEISGYDKNQTGSQKVTVSYTEDGITKTGNFEVTVKEKPVLGSISLEGPAKTQYWVGEELSLDGLTVTANYSDGTSKAVTDYRVTGFDSTKPGNVTVTVSYTEGEITKTANFTVSVKEKLVNVVLDSITLQEPDKTEYTVGEGMNLDGLKVTAHYSDGSSREVTGYEVSGFDSTKTGTVTVTVSYTEGGITKTASFDIQVKAESASSNGDNSSNSDSNTGDDVSTGDMAPIVGITVVMLVALGMCLVLVYKRRIRNR